MITKVLYTPSSSLPSGMLKTRVSQPSFCLVAKISPVAFLPSVPLTNSSSSLIETTVSAGAQTSSLIASLPSGKFIPSASLK